MVKVLTMVKLFWYFGLNNCTIYHGEIHFYHAMRDRHAVNVYLNMEKLGFYHGGIHPLYRAFHNARTLGWLIERSRGKMARCNLRMGEIKG
jgi:hypothetical protein